MAITPEQKAKIPEYVDKWTRIGLSCEPIDFEQAKEGIRDCYAEAGLNPDVVFTRVKSPLVLAYAAPLAMEVLNNLFKNTEFMTQVDQGKLSPASCNYIFIDRLEGHFTSSQQDAARIVHFEVTDVVGRVGNLIEECAEPHFKTLKEHSKVARVVTPVEQLLCDATDPQLGPIHEHSLSSTAMWNAVHSVSRRVTGTISREHMRSSGEGLLEGTAEVELPRTYAVISVASTFKDEEIGVYDEIRPSLCGGVSLLAQTIAALESETNVAVQGKLTDSLTQVTPVRDDLRVFDHLAHDRTAGLISPTLFSVGVASVTGANTSIGGVVEDTDFDFDLAVRPVQDMVALRVDEVRPPWLFSIREFRIGTSLDPIGSVDLGTRGGVQQDVCNLSEKVEPVKGKVVMPLDEIGTPGTYFAYRFCGETQIVSSDIKSEVRAEMHAEIVKSGLPEDVKPVRTRVGIVAVRSELDGLAVSYRDIFGENTSLVAGDHSNIDIPDIVNTHVRDEAVKPVFEDFQWVNHEFDGGQGENLEAVDLMRMRGVSDFTMRVEVIRQLRKAKSGDHLPSETQPQIGPVYLLEVPDDVENREQLIIDALAVACVDYVLSRKPPKVEAKSLADYVTYHIQKNTTGCAYELVRPDGLSKEDSTTHDIWSAVGETVGLVIGNRHRKSTHIVYPTINLMATAIPSLKWQHGPEARSTQSEITEQMRSARLAATEINHAVVESLKSIDNVRDVLIENWYRFLSGRLSASWMAYVDFVINECDANLSESTIRKADAYKKANSNAGWWYPTTQFAMVCEAPVRLNIEDNRLHHPTELAAEWPDGWGVAMWRGVRVPNHWIVGPKPTAREVMETQNVEVRRAGCEILGWSAILDELGAVMIDSHPNPQIGDLMEVDLPDSGRERFIRVVCGTGRVFALPVPPSCNTALEANAWTYGIDDYESFKPEIRT